MKLTQIALFGLATANKNWHSKEWEVQDAYFEEQEIVLQNPKVRSTKQWHECGKKPQKAWKGQDVTCSGAYCASVCPIGYRSQGHWRVKCQDDNTWSQDSFSPCITCPDMSDEIANAKSGKDGAEVQEIFVKNLPVTQFFCGDSSDTLTMRNKSYKGRGKRSKKKDVKCLCKNGQNGDPWWKKSCNWEFSGRTWYPHDVNTVTCKNKNAPKANPVVYSCEKSHQGQTKAKLRCKNSLIKVVKATYGKPHPSMCYADQAAGQTSMECATSMDHTEAVAAACNGQSSCRWHGTNKVSGDPCFGVEKHTEIEYTCEQKYCIKVNTKGCKQYSTGSDIKLFQNGILVDTLLSGFVDHEFCLPMTEINKYPEDEEDIWELKSTGSGSVCVSSVTVNGKPLNEFTQGNDKQSVWIGGAGNTCESNLEVTKSVKFQGRKIIRSQCTEDPQCSDRSIPGQCDNEVLILDPDNLPGRHYSGLYRIDPEMGEHRGRPVWRHVENDYKLVYGPMGGWQIHTLKNGGLAWSKSEGFQSMCPQPLVATGGYGFKIACSTYCIKATSSDSPSCVVNSGSYSGSEINVFKNGELIDFIPARFSEYENCIRNVNVEKDVFELKYTTVNHPKSSVPEGTNDGVCVTGVFLNDEPIMVGAGKDQAAFWIENDRNGCSRTERSFNEIMSTQNIKFKNGEVIESECTVPPVCRGQDPCVYVPFTTEYHYKALYDNANDYDGFIIEASDFTHDIHIGLSKHDVHEDKKWEIVIGGWKGTQSVIRSANQSPKSGHVKVNHSKAEYEALRNNIKLMFNDGSITVINGNTNEIFMQYTSDDIVKSELRFLLASGGFGGSGTFNTVKPINAWVVDTSVNCWNDCGEKGGACDVCNNGNLKGYCCRGDGLAGNGDCPQSAINAIPMNTQNYHTCVVSDQFCIRVTSSNSPTCVVNPQSHKGSPIEITQNGNLINTIPSGFSDHEVCLPAGFFNAETDIFEFKYTGGMKNNGVCVTSLFMDGKQILVGELEDQAAFWIENDRNGCTRTERNLFGQVMSTQNIKIQNGEVIESECTVPPFCEGPEPCVYVDFSTEYHYRVLYNNANDYVGFTIDASDFTNDIHIGLSKHDVHTDKKWEIVIGGWKGTRSVIRSANQTPKLGHVKVEHSKEEYESLINNFKVLFSDGSITIMDGDTNEIFMQYKSPDIKKSELRFLLASGGFAGSGTFNTIKPISAWNADPSFNCWTDCGEVGGACDLCNSGNQKGFCCRGDGAAGNGDCPVAAIHAIPDESQAYHMCVVKEEYCFRLTSSNTDECVVNPHAHTGSPIELTQNGNLIHTIPSRFSDDEFCIPAGLFDAENDIFELKYTGGSGNDGVCVTGLHVDDKQILLGANGDQKAFWIENDRNGCSRTERSLNAFSEIMSTQNIKLQNGQVIESECTVLPLCNDKSDCSDLTFDDSYNYQTVFNNLNELSGFTVTAPDFTHDIHIGLSKHDVHEDKKWEIVLGGWQGTKSVIRSKNQSPKEGLVKLDHTASDFNAWKNDGITIKIEDGAIRIIDVDDNVILEYESEDIVKDDLRFLLVSGGFKGSGTIANIKPISSWEFDGSVNCWASCDSKGGQCDTCNRGSVTGYCCRPDGVGGNGDCPNKNILNISPNKVIHHCFYQP